MPPSFHQLPVPSSGVNKLAATEDFIIFYHLLRISEVDVPKYGSGPVSCLYVIDGRGTDMAWLCLHDCVVLVLAAICKSRDQKADRHLLFLHQSICVLWLKTDFFFYFLQHFGLCQHSLCWVCQWRKTIKTGLLDYSILSVVTGVTSRDPRNRGKVGNCVFIAKIIRIIILKKKRENTISQVLAA